MLNLFQHLILIRACCAGVPDWHGWVQKTVGIVKDVNRILMPLFSLEISVLKNAASFLVGDDFYGAGVSVLVDIF